MVSSVRIERVLEQNAAKCIIDVRSPAEYEQGHIPGAKNIPLLNNEQRHLVGLCYAQQGKDAAVKLGLSLIGPCMASFVDQLEAIIGPPSIHNTVVVYCWRGGMRSASMAWLFDTAGWRAEVVSKGYKAWRRYALSIIEQPRRLRILCGHTGSGKTRVLKALQSRGEQFVDLEALASHRGSVFGWLGEDKHPSQETFDNNLAFALLHSDADRVLWLEDESRRIGSINIPSALWQQMVDAEVVRLHLPRPVRIKNLVQDYGQFSVHDLGESVQRISKKLGSEQTRAAMDALQSGDLELATHWILGYYDKYYQRGMDAHTQSPRAVIESSDSDPEILAEEILRHVL